MTLLRAVDAARLQEQDQWSVLVRLEAAYTLLRACLPGDLDATSERLWRRLVATFDCHYPWDGLDCIVSDLWPRLRNRALSGT